VAVVLTGLVGVGFVFLIVGSEIYFGHGAGWDDFFSILGFIYLMIILPSSFLVIIFNLAAKENYRIWKGALLVAATWIFLRSLFDLHAFLWMGVFFSIFSWFVLFLTEPLRKKALKKPDK
jgi:hypothetical protein